jgi:hypothetical protein
VPERGSGGRGTSYDRRSEARPHHTAAGGARRAGAAGRLSARSQHAQAARLMVTQIEKKSRQPARPHPDRSQYSVAPSPSKRALLSVLAALNEGKFSKAVDQFEHHSNSPTMRSASSFSTRGAWSNSFTNHESFSRTPWLRQMAPSNTEITPSWNGSSRQIRSCPTDLYSAECQFPCEVRPSCTLRTEESDSGPSTMTNWHLGAPVWLHFSRSGLSTSKVLANVCAHLGR